MIGNIENMEQILEHHITGFRQYILNPPIHLNYVSQNLCDMLELSRVDLLSGSRDLYEEWVHPADREKYRMLLKDLSGKKQSCSRSIEYRLVKRSGGILHVKDTLSVERREGGEMTATSVLSDVTDLLSDTEDLRFLNDTISCGCLRYTCGSQPRVTYMNERMFEMLRFPKDSGKRKELWELYQDNIYLMIPAQERHRFAHYLDRVYRHERPIAGEMPVLRCDGTRGALFGWVTKAVNERGEEEFQSVCMDVSERYYKNKADEIKRYIHALTDIYDLIFEYDLSEGTVKCLYGQGSAMFEHMENIPMQMREATEAWMREHVLEEDREDFREYFQGFFDRQTGEETGVPMQIRYRARSSDGTIRAYGGIFLKVKESVSLFCCRKIHETEDSLALKSQIISLKNMQEMVMRFTDGIAAFEITEEGVTPLYASDNVCHFFGYTREEWLPMMKEKTPLAEFVSRGNITYEQVLEVFKNGEGEFSYFELETNRTRRIRAVCSQRTSDVSAPRYVMMYKVEEEAAGEQEKRSVHIRTFGYFDVFVDDRPIAFRSEKAKELFALLVDRRGGYVASDEAIGFLWPEEPANTVTLARYRKVALRLKNILEEHGIGDVVESVDGKRRIATERVQCDLYDYLTGKEEFASLFKGSYLSNYSWGEITLGELLNSPLEEKSQVW